jgi:hypothetical protein
MRLFYLTKSVCGLWLLWISNIWSTNHVPAASDLLFATKKQVWQNKEWHLANRHSQITIHSVRT